MGLFDLFKKKKQQPQIATVKTPAKIQVQTPQYKQAPQYKQVPQYKSIEHPILPRNENYAIAAFIFISKNGAKIGKTKDDYARYFSYDFKVNDPIKYHMQVIKDGYLEKAEPDAALKALKMDQLKEILVKNGLSDKGKKEALILRIMESVDTDSLNLETYYIPTAKGWEHLHKYEYVFSLRNYDIKWEQFDSFKKTRPEHLKPNDIIWQMLNERYNVHVKGSDYGLARNVRYSQAKLLESENKKVDALYSYIAALYYDTSGYFNSGIIRKKEDLTIAPGLIKDIYRLKDFYDDQILERCYSRYVPNKYVSKVNFRRLLQDIFDDKSIDIRNYL